jgi:conjugal transfer pilus assembly protein TraF
MLITLTLHGEDLQKSWQQRHAEGWAWYHDFEKEEEPEEETPPPDPILVLKIAKEELERSLAKAILEPTEKNVLEYMMLQKKWTDQSRYFSRLWQYNLLEHPEIASLTPTTQYGIQIKKEEDAESRQKLIQDLAKDHTLVFFYEGGNPFSQAFSQVVKLFSKQYHWQVKAVSVNQSILKDFPNSISDPSIAEEMNVSFFPALFVADMKTMTATPVAYGMVTVSQIEENIVMQFGEEE